jgi:DNA modification methylase
MQLEWARLVTNGNTLIIAPLSVARQTVKEAERIGMQVTYSRDGKLSAGVTITNYEMIQHFESKEIEAIVLDESSILKSIDGKTRKRLTEKFFETPFKLCCTATPAPNDITEIANHAEFLGLSTRMEMLGTYFVNNSNKVVHGGWQLKGHAVDKFYEWLATWSMSVRLPSDLGFEDDGYILPQLKITPQFVKVDYCPPGELLFTHLSGITDRSHVRKKTMKDRVVVAADLINGGSDEQWIAWCGLNEEGRLLHKAIPDSVLIEGQDSPESKTQKIEGFQDGNHRVIVTKPRIAGFGMNFQCASRMTFVGLSDSFEAYYQCIRRSWRFGQTDPVEVHIVLSEPEREIYSNVLRKEQEAKTMADELLVYVRQWEKSELRMEEKEVEQYQRKRESEKDWTMVLGDAVEEIQHVDDRSVGLSIFSPPFATLFSYSDMDRDMGNSRNYIQFFEHFRFLIKELLRVTIPGRLCCVHCQQLPMTKVHDGVTACRDFRGDLIRAFQGHEWLYHGEVCIDKDPQAQAIRTKAQGLLFVTKERDSALLRPAYADYILVFRNPGDNPTPVKSDVTNDEWISWARPIWYGIKETDTLQYRSARAEKDEKHICPLQLETILRCVRLWSNRGDLVLSPFAGIGSEGYVALENGRRFHGIELKDSYWRQACANLRVAVSKCQESERDLLSMMDWKETHDD